MTVRAVPILLLSLALARSAAAGGASAASNGVAVSCYKAGRTVCRFQNAKSAERACAFTLVYGKPQADKPPATESGSIGIAAHGTSMFTPDANGGVWLPEKIELTCDGD